MTTKAVAQLDKDGYFIGVAIADLSPMDKEEVWLIPGRAVDVPPPVVPEGKRAKWNGTGFDLEDIPAPEEPLPQPPPDPVALAVSTVQSHLDTTARAHRYDSILSACSYAAAPNAFQAESQAFLAWRAACWSHLYQVQADVEAGVRALPSIDELIAELPALVLP